MVKWVERNCAIGDVGGITHHQFEGGDNDDEGKKH